MAISAKPDVESLFAPLSGSRSLLADLKKADSKAQNVCQQHQLLMPADHLPPGVSSLIERTLIELGKNRVFPRDYLRDRDAHCIDFFPPEQFQMGSLHFLLKELQMTCF